MDNSLEIALLVSVLSMLVGVCLVAYGIASRKVKTLEGQLFSQYAALLFTEMNVHERLDNPIKAIVSALPMMESSDQSGVVTNIKYQIETIRDGIRYMRRTLNMLDGREQLGKFEINLNQLIAEKILLKNKHGENVKLVDNGIQYSVVATRMEMLAAVSIILDNALLYGEAPVTIEVTRNTENNKIRIIVKNGGNNTFDQSTKNVISSIENARIDADIRKLVSMSSIKGHGNGVGLIVAQLIAKAYNGKLILIDRNTTFETDLWESTAVILELSQG